MPAGKRAMPQHAVPRQESYELRRNMRLHLLWPHDFAAKQTTTETVTLLNHLLTLLQNLLKHLLNNLLPLGPLILDQQRSPLLTQFTQPILPPLL